MTTEISFGEWLRQARMTRRLTQVDLAKGVDYSVDLIRSLEASRRRPSNDIIRRLVDFFNAPEDVAAAFEQWARGTPITSADGDRQQRLQEWLEATSLVPSWPQPAEAVPAPPAISVGTLIRRFRVAAGLTQEQLAERAGVSLRGVSDLERGVADAPQLSRLEHLAKALNLTADERRQLATTARAERLTASGAAMSLPPPPFGLLLRRYRVAAKLTLEELAQAAGLSTQAVTNAERGTGSKPGPATVRLLARGLRLESQAEAELQEAATRGSLEGTVTVLCADLQPEPRPQNAPSRARWEIAARQREILHRAAEGHGGVVFKATTEKLTAAFAHPADALEAAEVGQRALLTEDQGVQIALHTGEVAVHLEQYVGPTLDYSDQLAAAARPGQVVISAATADLLQDSPRKKVLLDLGEYRFVGQDWPRRVYQLELGIPDTTTERQQLRGTATRIAAAPAIASAPSEAAGVFHEGKRVKGRKGHYVITKLMALGPRGETARARPEDDARREVGDVSDVIVKAPRIEGVHGSPDVIGERLTRIREDLQVEVEISERMDSDQLLMACTAKLLDQGTVKLRKLSGQTSLDVPFVVQEYIKGRSLRVWCQEEFAVGKDSPRGFNGIPRASEWFALARALLEALARIHRQRIVHGDIRPSNIIIEGTKSIFNVVFTDFFYSSADNELIRSNFTDDDSYRYYAPERIINIDSTWYSSLDIFSICGVLFYLASGQNPVLTFNEEETITFRRKRNIRSDVKNVILNVNPNLYRENPGIIDVIMYGLRPKAVERAFNVEHIMELIDIFLEGEKDASARGASPVHGVIGTRPLSQEKAATLPDLLTEVKRLRNEANALAAADRLPVTRLLADELVRVASQFDSAVGTEKAEPRTLLRARKVQQANPMRMKSGNTQEGRLFAVPGGDRDRLVNRLLRGLQGLRAGDEIWAQTTSLFWHNCNFGHEGRILTMLKMAALKGVAVRWLLIIDEDRERDDPEEVAPILRAQLAAVEEVRSVLLDERERETSKALAQSYGSRRLHRKRCPPSGEYSVKVWLVDKTERSKQVRQATTFVLIRQHLRGTLHETLIAPTYISPGGPLSSLRFWRKAARTVKLRPMFLQNWERPDTGRVYTIDELLASPTGGS